MPSGKFVLIALAAQALLLFLRPNLLPVWGDEQFTLDVAQGPFRAIHATVAADAHPPLYYVLQWLWLRALPGAEPVIAARCLSALAMLAATAILWKRWLAPRLSPAIARVILVLWVTSPFVIMYGRMARSYSLQLLLFLIAAGALWRACDRPDRGQWIRAGLWTAAVLWVHYVPGFCLLAVAGMLFVIRQPAGWRWFVAAAVLAYLPWMPFAAETAYRQLGSHVYQAAQGPAAEHVLRACYIWMATHLSETQPLALMSVGAVTAPFIAWLAWRGARQAPLAGLLFVAAAGAAYFMTSRVLIYSMLPARVLFLLPFWLLLLGLGAREHRRLGAGCAAASLLLSAAGLLHYFRLDHFRNKGYLVPFPGVAETTKGHGVTPLVLVDAHAVDTRPLWPLLPAGARVVMVNRPPAEMALGASPVVVHLRGGRDLSPGGWNDEIAALLARDRNARTHRYVPYDATDRTLMRWFGWRSTPTHVYESTIYSRPPGRGADSGQ